MKGARTEDLTELICSITLGPSSNPDPEELFLAKERALRIERALRVLRPLEKAVMQRRMNGYSLGAVGVYLDLSRERIRQICIDGTNKLSKVLGPKAVSPRNKYLDEIGRAGGDNIDLLDHVARGAAAAARRKQWEKFREARRKKGPPIPPEILSEEYGVWLSSLVPGDVVYVLSDRGVRVPRRVFRTTTSMIIAETIRARKTDGRIFGDIEKGRRPRWLHQKERG